MRRSSPSVFAGPFTILVVLASATQDPQDREKPGIAVRDDLIIEKCAACHEQDDRDMMGRISYMRKSPEGWSISIKRMIRLYDVEATPQQAREMVRYLANEHGLARSEAERGLYESERRVHWSEQQHDQEMLQACASCHPLGRVLNQQRDTDEWKELKAMHLAYFPVARQSIGSMFPRRGRGNRGGGGDVAEASASRGGRGARGGARGAGGGQGNGGNQRQGDRGDRVLAQLAEELPLFSDAWNEWSVNRREVPLGGTWTVSGHEVGQGDLRGQATLRRVAEDEYEVDWDLGWDSGRSVQRSGRGLLYAGYSWRGRATDPGPGGTTWREVLLVDDEWRSMKGRFFTGAYDEIGVDVQLHRHVGLPQVFTISNRAVMVPSEDHLLDVYGESFPASPEAVDFRLGDGVTVTDAERVSDNHVRLTLDVAEGTRQGERLLSFGPQKGSATILLYDTADYLRVTPLQGLARVGGGMAPKQYERFEAIAVNRGPDGEPYTDDDYDIKVVDASWSVIEFPVRENDDDLQYVGTIDADSGVFTPAIDGPNPQRKWKANNIGEVYVVADATVDGQMHKARSHLIVTVPLYQRGNMLEWEDEPRDGREDR